MSDFDWNEFDTGTADGDYPEPFKFTQVGDKVAGTITTIRSTTFGGASPHPVPELWIQPDTGPVVSVAASNVRLRNLLVQHRPNVGDRIAIVYTGDGERKPGKNPPKLFDVSIKPADSNGATAAPATAAVSAADLI